MKLFLISDPKKPSQYAMLSISGTWSESAGLCATCGDPGQDYIEPLLIEWEYGTDRIGDFSWDSYTCVVVDKVRAFLEENGYECSFGKVAIVGRDVGKSRMPRVAYPYTGPHLSWMRPTLRVRLNEEKSGVFLESDCPTCGQKRYKFRPQGIYIDKEDWNGEQLFRIEQFGRSKATFITETALKHLTDENFTNLKPTPAGEISF